jgi:hypothetical protein
MNLIIARGRDKENAVVGRECASQRSRGRRSRRGISECHIPYRADTG